MYIVKEPAHGFCMCALFLLDDPSFTDDKLVSGACLSTSLSGRSLLCLSETIPPIASSENDLSDLLLMEGSFPPPHTHLLAFLGLA